jgi:hypothetical protein
MSEPSERLLKEIRKAGKDSRLRFLASPLGDETDVPSEQAAFLARVETVDRAGIWVEYLEGPDTVRDVQVLWPDPGWRYTNIRFTPAPARSRPIVREEPPAPTPRPKTKRRSPTPPPSSSDDEVSSNASEHPTVERHSKRSRSADSDSRIRDIATGDRGVWTRVVMGLKIPYEIPDDAAWMYLYAAQPMSGNAWRQHALAFRLRLGASFRSMTLAEECDHTLALLTEIVDSKLPRSDKQAWTAPFWLLSRFLQLVLRASSMGGAAAATKFDELFRAAISTKDGKLDVNDCVQQALAHERSISLKNSKKPKGPFRESVHTQAHSTKRDGEHGRTRDRLSASINKIAAAAKKRE